MPLGSQMCWAASQGIGKAWSSLSMSLLSEVEVFTAVGEEGVVKGGGEDNLAANGGGIGQAKGERLLRT